MTRFFIDPIISTLANTIVGKYGQKSGYCILLPSPVVATECVEFLLGTHGGSSELRIIDLSIRISRDNFNANAQKLLAKPLISAVIYPTSYSQKAKTFWQHTGQGVSSRRAEIALDAFRRGHLLCVPVENRKRVLETTGNSPLRKGPKRYRKEEKVANDARVDKDDSSVQYEANNKDHARFIEERFGRNLNLSLAVEAKSAIRKRIAGALAANHNIHDASTVEKSIERRKEVKGLSEDDVYLFPTGMSSIFNTHRILRLFRGEMRSICYGFPYIDTLKILEKWGAGCLFFGHGSADELDELGRRCQSGEKFLALFCEFPGNPLLKTPDLVRIRALADQYEFAVVVDETIGNFLNVHVLPAADVVVSSLTKVFSGDSNVMGGSAVLNPQSRYYSALKQSFAKAFEDDYWPEDALFMERNSRDFVSRIDRINSNAVAICETLLRSPVVKQVYYPKYGPTKRMYDHFRTEEGGYGGLLSVTFHYRAAATSFFDALETAKGPSLGTNFTLSCPYVLLAHYNELDWAASFGCEADLIRVSVGLEDAQSLRSIFQKALDVALKAKESESCS